jgi:tetratricopeptide (TPR) repeat protein
MPDPAFNIFISYSHSDRDFVDRLEADLRQREFGTWMDRLGLVGGHKWRRELQDAIDRSQVLLVVLSPESVASEYVQAEYGYATDEGKIVIPIYYRPCKVPMELRGIQWIDFQSSYEQGLEALVKDLTKGASTAGPSTPSEHSGISQQGKLPSQHEILHGQAEPKVQVERLWNVPFARNPFFTGRSQLLVHLHERLHSPQQTALNHTVALSGMGGIGKTQIAVEYAYRYREEYLAVFWVHADSREALVADFITLARLLALTVQDAQDQMLIVAAVKSWMEQHEGWLLVLNNADDLSLLTNFLPSGGKGHILLTTRSQATGRIAESLPVEKLELTESMQFLLCRAKLLTPGEPLDHASRAMHEDAQELIIELDGLPLAIDQAGAYIEEIGCSLSEYLALYRRRRLALLKRQSSFSADYPHTVANTWALSFQQIEQADPAAAELLRLCSFLQPDAIPESILTQGAEYLGPDLQEVAADPLLLNDAIQLLRRYSLIKRDPETKQLNVHRLVQVVLRENLDAPTQQLWAERSVRAVNAAFPEVEFANWNSCELYLPHAQVCAQLIEQYHLNFPEAAHLLHSTGRYLRDRGHYAQAEPLLQRALTISEQVLAPAQSEIASILTDLEQLYEYLGKYGQAEPLMQRALALQEQALGANHPNVAESLNNLAGIDMYQGKYAQAEPLMQRALTIREQALGANHPDVASSLNNLGVLYMYLGKYAQAASLYQRAIALDERILGSEHPETLLFLANLANLYTLQGKYSEGEQLNQRVLAARERVLGPQHPRTAITLFNLAQLYYFQSKYEQAQALAQRALTIHEQGFGPENPRTLQVVLYLAQIYQAQGQNEQAESLYQRALAGFESKLGSEHPYVAETLTNLARLHALQGDDEQAEPLYQRALSIYEQALGSSHPSIAQTLHYLAQLYEKQGKDDQASPLYQRALTIREQALGPDHPATVATREAFSALLHRQQGPNAQPDTTAART